MMTDTAVRSKKSTTVRFREARVAAIRAAFAVLERVAPGPASRWALDLWCTLPDNAGRRRDERPGPGEMASASVDGHRIAVEVWGQGPPVYLMHGWGGWRGQLGGFVQPLVDAGYRVVGFDAPSHGESGPGVMGQRRGNGLEFARSLQVLAAEYGDPAAVIAHSFGCATSAVALADGLPIGRLAYVAPAVDPMLYVNGISDLFGFGPRTKAAMITRIEQLAGRPLGDFDPSRIDSGVPPALIVHDHRDKEVPYAQGVGLDVAWPSAELLSTDGLGHQRVLRDRAVIAAVVDFVTADSEVSRAG